MAGASSWLGLKSVVPTAENECTSIFGHQGGPVRFRVVLLYLSHNTHVPLPSISHTCFAFFFDVPILIMALVLHSNFVLSDKTRHKIFYMALVLEVSTYSNNQTQILEIFTIFVHIFSSSQLHNSLTFFKHVGRSCGMSL